MIICRVCDKQFKMITNTHLKKVHQMTTEEYLRAFPGVALCDEEMRDRYTATRMHATQSECLRPGCASLTTAKHNRYCSRSCSFSHRLSKDGRNEQAGNRNGRTHGWHTLAKHQKHKARERDNYVCQRCQIPVKGRGAHVHHIIPEKCFEDLKKAHDLENLITLCRKCHKTVEWQNIINVFQRALILDEVMSSEDPTWQTLDSLVRESIFIYGRSNA